MNSIVSNVQSRFKNEGKRTEKGKEMGGRRRRRKRKRRRRRGNRGRWGGGRQSQGS